MQKHLDNALNFSRKNCGEGRVANYIPALAKIDPHKLGMAVALTDGRCFIGGDADEPFSIQSISKVFTLALALEHLDDLLWQAVGQEPSGSSFNSIVQLETENGKPRNPLINAGAIVTTDRLIGDRPAESVIAEILSFVRARAGDGSVFIDDYVARTESESGARNRSLAHFIDAFGNLKNPVEAVLRVYFHQCALAMSCKQLAQAGLFLALGENIKENEKRVIAPQHCRRINALMLGCGHYDNSGDFAFRVGLPGKSGVGGGILAICPGRGAIAVWSPGLNMAGTSLAGSAAMEYFTRTVGWSVFG